MRLTAFLCMYCIFSPIKSEMQMPHIQQDCHNKPAGMERHRETYTHWGKSKELDTPGINHHRVTITGNTRTPLKLRLLVHQQKSTSRSWRWGPPRRTRKTRAKSKRHKDPSVKGTRVPRNQVESSGGRPWGPGNQIGNSGGWPWGARELDQKLWWTAVELKQLKAQQ